MVDWSSAVEISATEFEQHMANISHHNDVPEPYPAFKLKPRSERDNSDYLLDDLDCSGDHWLNC